MENKLKAYHRNYRKDRYHNDSAFRAKILKQNSLFAQQKKKKHSEELLASIDIQLCDNLLKDKTKKEALNLIGAYYDIKGK